MEKTPLAAFLKAPAGDNIATLAKHMRLAPAFPPDLSRDLSDGYMELVAVQR